MSSSVRYLGIAYLPPSGYIHPIIQALRASPSPKAAEASKNWSTSGTGATAIALSSKLVMLTFLVERVEASVTPIRQEIASDPDVAEAIADSRALVLSDNSAVFQFLVDIDAVIFEFRSAYELLGKFVRSFFQLFGETPPEQNDLLAMLESRGVPTAWIEPLRARRILFFHNTAPWLLYRVHTVEPFDAEEIITSEPGMDPAAAGDAMPLRELLAVKSGLANALAAIQAWMVEKINALPQ